MTKSVSGEKYNIGPKTMKIDLSGKREKSRGMK